ncbi:MAG: hypothetical protein LBQ30_09925 [Treponema sp.]|jgi:hypothetical protein|nr:hypothetical protein [Treponema sp.]
MSAAEALIIKKRNQAWKNNPYIPGWVTVETVGLDQFFTKPEVAKRCYELFLSYLQKQAIDLADYTFIEPAAGNGAFFDLLQHKKRIGFDLMPLAEGIGKQDFLSWYPSRPATVWEQGDLFYANTIPEDEKYICIGNPPFGYRAWLALAFMQHASLFSDYIGMILPMAFQSDGKGSPKHRIKTMELVYSEILPKDSFYTPNGTKCMINTLFQIWKKGKQIDIKKKTCNTWVDIFTVDMRKERLCGKQKMEKADFFLQRTYYDRQPHLVTDFSAVRYVCGYGIIVKQEKERVTKVLDAADWNEYSNLAAHNCRHISRYHIEKVLTDKGYTDDRL